MADNTIVGYVSRVSVEIIQKEFPSLFEAMSAEFRLQVLSSIFPHVNVFRYDGSMCYTYGYHG